MNWNEVKEPIRTMLQEKTDPKEIAEILNVSEYDLRQFIHRYRLFDYHRNGRNLAYEVISILMRGNPDYFKPNRMFFNAVKIGQKRWWALYKGAEKITDMEYLRLVTHLKVTRVESNEARQLNWLESLEKNINKINCQLLDKMKKTPLNSSESIEGVKQLNWIEKLD